MNWIGGARSRIKAVSDKKKQREFFQKQRRESRDNGIKEQLSVATLSHDLIAFHLAQRNAKNKHKIAKPTKIINDNLEKGPPLFVLNADLPETPLQGRSSINNILSNGWKAKSKHENKIQNVFLKSKNNSPQIRKGTMQAMELSVPEILTSSKEASPLPNVDEITEEFSQKYDIHNSEISVSTIIRNRNNKNTRHLSEINGNNVDTISFDSCKILEEGNTLENEGCNNSQNFIEDYLNENVHSSKQMQAKNKFTTSGKYQLKKKMKIIEKISSNLSKHENGLNYMLHQSKLSYSKLSKCTFESIPMKVSRNVDCFRKTSKGRKPELEAEVTISKRNNYRQSLEDLENMIENCDLKLKKRKITDHDVDYKKYNNHMDENEITVSNPPSVLQPLDLTPFSPLTNMDTLVQTKTRKKHFPIPSYKTFQANLSRMHKLKMENSASSIRKERKIQFRNATVLNDNNIEDSLIENTFDSANYQSEHEDRDEHKMKTFENSSLFLKHFPISPLRSVGKSQKVAQTSFTSSHNESLNDNVILNDEKQLSQTNNLEYQNLENLSPPQFIEDDVFLSYDTELKSKLRDTHEVEEGRCINKCANCTVLKFDIATSPFLCFNGVNNNEENSPKMFSDKRLVINNANNKDEVIAQSEIFQNQLEFNSKEKSHLDQSNKIQIPEENSNSIQCNDLHKFHEHFELVQHETETSSLPPTVPNSPLSPIPNARISHEDETNSFEDPLYLSPSNPNTLVKFNNPVKDNMRNNHSISDSPNLNFHKKLKYDVILNSCNYKDLEAPTSSENSSMLEDSQSQHEKSMNLKGTLKIQNTNTFLENIKESILEKTADHEQNCLSASNYSPKISFDKSYESNAITGNEADYLQRPCLIDNDFISKSNSLKCKTTSSHLKDHLGIYQSGSKGIRKNGDLDKIRNEAKVVEEDLLTNIIGCTFNESENKNIENDEEEHKKETSSDKHVNNSDNSNYIEKDVDHKKFIKDEKGVQVSLEKVDECFQVGCLYLVDASVQT